MTKTSLVPIATALALAACGGSNSSSSTPGTSSHAPSCTTGQTACGSACCAAGQACSPTQQCVAGRRIGIKPDGVLGGKGTVTGEGVTCTTEQWPGCWAMFPDGASLTFTATAAPGSTFYGFTRVDAASGDAATLTANADRNVYAWFGVTGKTPACAAIATSACVHGTFSGGGITRPVTMSGGVLVDANQLPCTYVGGYNRSPEAWCYDEYVCGEGAYAIDVDVTYAAVIPGWIVGSTSTNWYSDVLCDGVCTSSSQCGANQMCSSGHCVARPSGGSGACSACLDACRGLPGCCTGVGCICDSEC